MGKSTLDWVNLIIKSFVPTFLIQLFRSIKKGKVAPSADLRPADRSNSALHQTAS